MSPAWRAIRALVIGAGAMVAVACLLAVRLEDWRIYLVFSLVALAVYLPSVELLPRMTIGIAQQGATIGFLYVGGLPIVLLSFLPTTLVHALRRAVPASLWARAPRLAALAERRDWFDPNLRTRAERLADEATYALGLAVRWLIAQRLAAPLPPTASLWSIAAAELGGYAVWTLFSFAPIYRFGPLVSLSLGGDLRTALQDVGLLFALAMTPFVFLIAYGYQTDGLRGAAAWALTTIGLHVMLRRLNQRRLDLEEQNRRLAALNRELEHRERLSAIGKMSSIVSHQILQQLGVIGIYADLIRNPGDEASPSAAIEKARDNAAAIQGALGDVNRVLSDLLVFSRDLRLNLYEQALAPVLEDCVEGSRAAASARAIQLSAACEPADLVVAIDKLKMKQVLTNVLRNAIEASPEGAEVELRAAVQDGEVEVSVSDRGAGVPAAEREAIFAPFFTTKEQGTGLGLAIARQFTEAHGGRLWVEERRGRPGARFVVRLPLHGPPGAP